MGRLLIGVVLLLLPCAARATTWTCTLDGQAILQPGPYVTFGSCTGSGVYTVTGDPLGATNGAADTASALCGTGSRRLVDMVVTSTAAAAGTTAGVLVFDHTNLKLQVYTSNGAGPALLAEATAAVTPPGLFRFIAFCK